MKTQIVNPVHNFTSLKEVFNYRKTCPSCNCEIRLDQYDVEKCYDDFNSSLKFQILNSISYLEINIDSEKINLTLNNIDCQIFSGEFGHKLKFLCFHCHNYSYIIQLWVDLEKLKIINITLFSEYISWMDTDMHSLKNYYEDKKTEYCHSSLNKVYRTDFPLVDININNPQETLDRLEKIRVML